MSTLIQSAASGQALQTETITITVADDFSGLGAGITSGSKSSGTIPANARFIGFAMEATVNSDGGFGNPISWSFGPNGDETAFAFNQQVTIAAPYGTSPTGWFEGRKLPNDFFTVLFDSGGQDLNTYTVGSFTFKLFYFIE